MADFSAAYKRVMTNEGGYSNHANDKGGETYAGIARKFWPQWPGWPIVDSSQPLKSNQMIDKPEIHQHVQGFYKTNFWDKFSGDQIPDQKIGEFIFDWFVNSGGIALKKVQEVLGVAADGQFGKGTLGAIAAKDAHQLLQSLIAARLEFVHNIVKNNPSQNVFLKGWEARINAFK